MAAILQHGTGSPRSSAPGFTLVEVLLVLALMALVGAVLLPVAGTLFADPGGDDPEDLLAGVLQEARRTAVLSGRPVALRFDAPGRRFVWTGDGTDAPQGERAAGGVRQVDFLPATRGATGLVRGQLVETGRPAVMDFFPDGTCTAVRLRMQPVAGAARTVAIDPWTCAPGLEVGP